MLREEDDDGPGALLRVTAFGILMALWCTTRAIKQVWLQWDESMYACSVLPITGKRMCIGFS